MAAGSTYTPIATTTATGSQSSITFSSIASTYTDLILIIAGNTTNLAAAMRFNGDGGTNYSRTVLRGDGTSATSFRQTNQTYIAIDASYSQPGQNMIVHIMNYVNATTNKTALLRSNNSALGVDQGVGLWRSTAAINQVGIISTGGTNFTSTSTFTLYGIAKA